MFFLTWSFLWLRNLLSPVFILFGIITEIIYLFIPNSHVYLDHLREHSFQCMSLTNQRKRKRIFLYHRIKTITVIFFRWPNLIQKINLYEKANGEVKCCSHCSNRQNCVGIVLKPSACNVFRCIVWIGQSLYLLGFYCSCLAKSLTLPIAFCQKVKDNE